MIGFSCIIKYSHLHSTMYLFQPAMLALRHPVDTHLHSTMYLFQQIWPDCAAVYTLIYIPLCIYFNLDAVLNSETKNSIYIPLCIYFNAVDVVILFRRKIFTFHYVSISTKEAQRMAKITLIFTFHYVSISTTFTMYRIAIAPGIYIPLCIYFNAFILR